MRATEHDSARVADMARARTRWALGDLEAERERHGTLDLKVDVGGAETPDTDRLAILLEEVLEVVRAVNDDEPTMALRTELVQVGALCVAWIEGLDRAL